jgi:hypothetical protein
MCITNRKEAFYMQYTLRDYYQVKLVLVSIMSNLNRIMRKTPDEQYLYNVIRTALNIIQNRIDELSGKNDRLLEYYRKYIEKSPK